MRATTLSTTVERSLFVQHPLACLHVLAVSHHWPSHAGVGVEATEIDESAKWNNENNSVDEE